STDDPRRVDAFGGMTGRHPDVDQHEIRMVLAREFDQRGAVASLTQDCEVLAGQQAGEALTKQDVILGHEDTDRLYRRGLARSLRPVRTGSHNAIVGPVAMPE